MSQYNTTPTPLEEAETLLTRPEPVAAPEVTPLPPRRVTYTSLPHKGQLAILMLCRATETLTVSSIHSYMFFQLRHFDPLASDATISAHAGLIVSARTAAHVCTTLLWGRFADWKYCGRKPVLVIGLLSSSVCMLAYGFSTSFAAAVAWQAIDGALNNSLPVVRCMSAELHRDKRVRVRALSLLPLSANVGTLVGSVLGGFLTTSAKQYPPGSVLSKYPYAGPNLCISLFNIIMALSVIFGLNETLEDARSTSSGFSTHIKEKLRTIFSRPQRERLEIDESAPLIPDAQSDDQQSAESHQSQDPEDVENKMKGRWQQLRKICTSNVLGTMVALFLVSGHLSTFMSVWAIFLSVPRMPAEKQTPPFQFSGGLGMDPSRVGIAISLLGALGIVLQVVIYPTLNDKYGTVPLWRAALFVFPLTYFIAPFCGLASSYGPDGSSYQQGLAWALIVLVLILFVLGRTGAASATTMLINDCTPHPSVRGTIHSIGTLVSNLSRSVFPAITLPIFGYGLHIGVVGLGFWCLAALSIIACLASRVVADENHDQERGPEESQTHSTN